MKILMLTPYVPYPPNSGGQTRTFNLIKNLSKKHEISSFSFLRTDHPEPDLTQLRKYCRQVRVFRRKKSFASIAKIFKTGFSLYPYLVNMYLEDKIKQALAQELAGGQYDLIHVETYYIMANLPPTIVPVLLAEQTIEYQVYQHFAQTTRFWPAKPFLAVDVAKHKYWEKHFWQEARKVVAMSQDDKEKMLELVPDLDVSVVPNGVDSGFFAKKIALQKREFPRLLFVGNFNWLQNREAAEVLVHQIWPLVKVKLPRARLWIVGREPTPDIKALAGDDVTVSGDVEDIRTAYQGSDLLIAPIYGGGGTRYKILEAMASGLPVVSTQIGIKGIGAQNRKHALITNNQQQLADDAVELLTNRQTAKKIAQQAKELVVKNFDWTGISAGLDKIYEETAFRHHS
ncbi:MAG: glycosyltransferase family 4 protein [Patescibacteria group bacterium]|nr:glycosyltransferase family 4 protein [Patescibacteria group bacterium]MCL5431704.1 glycosyltransferase family 4 protein [Patescibacteria group bacterium]